MSYFHLFWIVGMHLVNTFEEKFENLDGYSGEHAKIKLVASRMSQSVVSLASFKGNSTIILLWKFHIFVSWLIINISISSYVGRVRLFTCTGTIIGHMPSEMSILTSANLVTCHEGGTTIADNLKVSAASKILSSAYVSSSLFCFMPWYNCNMLHEVI